MWRECWCPLSNKAVRRYLAAIGKKGGEATTPAKRAASAANLAAARANGKRGGRPKKETSRG